MQAREYIHHTAATERYLRQHYAEKSMREISSILLIPVNKLYKLAERQGIKKRKGKT